MTIEFYSAEPQALIAAFAVCLDSDWENEALVQLLAAYPVADFSLHLHRDDLDSLCQLLRKHNPSMPAIFRHVLLEQIWDDGPAITESLTILADYFAPTVAALNEQAMENVARDWAATFPYQEPVQQTPAYQALWQLQAVSRDVVAQKRALILHVAGHFFF